MRRNKQNRKPKRRRKFYYISTALAFVLAAGAGLAYEYMRLQPQSHFHSVPVLATGNAAGNQSTDAAPPPKTVPGTFNVLLIGTDTRKGQTLGHSDSMMLVHVNLNTHTYSALSIPRDTRVSFPPYGYTKLTSVQYMDEVKYGTKAGILDTVKYISSLTGVPINYYAETNYWGLQDIVNVVGGINMNLPFNVTLTHAWYAKDSGKTFTKGTHFLNGRLTTEVVHERYSVPGTDYGRQMLQEAALVGIAKELARPKNVSKIPEVVKVLPDYLVATNLSTSDMMSIFLGVKGNFHPDTQVRYYQVKGRGELIYNDLLKAKDDEVILQSGQLQAAAKKYLTK